MTFKVVSDVVLRWWGAHRVYFVEAESGGRLGPLYDRGEAIATATRLQAMEKST